MAFRMASAGRTCFSAGTSDGYSTPSEFYQQSIDSGSEVENEQKNLEQKIWELGTMESQVENEQKTLEQKIWELGTMESQVENEQKTLEQKIWELETMKYPFPNVAVATAIQDPPAPHPVPRPSTQQNLGHVKPKTSSRYLARLAANGQVASVGSMNHPHACGGPCKHVKRKGGCKEGAACPKCHFCFWAKASAKALEVAHEVESIKARLGREPNLQVASISATTAYPMPANFQSKLTAPALSNLEPAKVRFSTLETGWMDPEPILYQPQMLQMPQMVSGVQSRAFMTASEPEDSIVWLHL
eukprot:TRINITY_DN17915_c0_g2_i1.p1 TRINITY_DN17915_c0_g2~~TRINITY_DN17915_c0_g2_i1.p1  ORF type:complete len:311 (-),score=49.62 TRINITY_DN17915_c0_g2_i1:77-979(-)